MPLSVSADWADRCITHLFTSFVRQHDFTGQPHGQYQDLERLIHSSPCLQNAALALSSLDLESKEHAASGSGQNDALKYYGNAITLLRSELGRENRESGNQDSLLWSTLLLGMFELMYDTTGDGFLFHFVQGTSALLRAQGPAYCLQKDHRRFFRLARMFEMSRAVVFWNDTFLQETQWQCAIKNMRDNDGPVDSSEAFEELLALMGKVIRLNHDTQSVISKTTPASSQPHHIEQLRSVALQGLEIQRCLELWHSKTLKYSAATSESPPDTQSSILSRYAVHTISEPQTLLALIYYHTATMNVISNFSPHLHFPYLSISVPSLSLTQMQEHVNANLDLVAHALYRTALAGAMLLWPVRAAGVRSVTREQLVRVDLLLREIEKRGFVVARSFGRTLRQQWARKGLI